MGKHDLTLIELLVVAVIIVTLAVMLFSALSKACEKARRVVCALCIQMIIPDKKEVLSVKQLLGGLT